VYESRYYDCVSTIARYAMYANNGSRFIKGLSRGSTNQGGVEQVLENNKKGHV
jgi:hypothetical protein